MVIRQSGRPASIQKATEYEQEWKKLYDLAEAKSEKVFQKTSGKLQTTPKMFILQRYLRYIERQLNLKYGSEEMHPIPKSHKAWMNLLSQYEDVPILIAKRADGNSIVAILMDTLNQ